MENLGRRSICQLCNKKIYHTGKYWTHVEGSPRHPATPLDTDNLKAEIAELEYALSAKKQLLGLLERPSAPRPKIDKLPQG